MNTHELKTALRNGPVAKAGCYPLYFVTEDGAALSFEAVRQEYRQVFRSTRDKLRDGWQVVAVTVNWEDQELYCDHTGKRLPAAYE